MLAHCGRCHGMALYRTARGTAVGVATLPCLGSRNVTLATIERLDTTQARLETLLARMIPHGENDRDA